MNKETLLNKVPRMFWQTENHPCNYLNGLDKLISENLDKKTVMAEIGSYAGVSSHLFAEAVNHIYCIDQWQPYPEVPLEYMIEGERLFNNFLKRYSNVTKVKKSSTEAAKDFENEYFDFVYIDAFHAYEAVVEDIKCWQPKIKKGGFIGGHDIHHGGVKQAVIDCIGENMNTYADMSWIIKI